MSIQIDEITALVARARRGDTQAKGELCHKTYNLGYYSALKVLGNPDDALDIVQEAYLRAFSNLDRLQKDETFVRWFSCIVMNLTRDALKKRRPTLFAEMRAPDSEADVEFEDDRIEFKPDASLDHDETRRLVEQMVDTLPEDQRICVMMYYYNELSVAEIAGALELSENTVKSRLRYARERIRGQVLELERTQGVKLYSVAPMGLLMLLLRQQAAASALTPAAEAALAGSVAAGAGAVGAGAVGAATASGGAATASSLGAGAAAAGAKAAGSKVVLGVVAGVVALGLAAGGIFLAVRSRRPTPQQMAMDLLEDLAGGISSPVLSRPERTVEGAEDEEVPVEPEIVDPLEFFTISFSGLDGVGRYELEVDASGEVRAAVVESSQQGKLFNGDALTISFSLDGESATREREDIVLTTREHIVVVEGLLQTAPSLDGVDHAALDAAMFEYAMERMEDEFAGNSGMRYELSLTRREGFYGVNPENPSDNTYVTCYDLSYTRISQPSGNRTEDLYLFVYVWSDGVWLEDGVLRYDEEAGLRANWSNLRDMSEEEAQDYVRIHTSFGNHKEHIEVVQPQG